MFGLTKKKKKSKFTCSALLRSLCFEATACLGRVAVSPACFRNDAAQSQGLGLLIYRSFLNRYACKCIDIYHVYIIPIYIQRLGDPPKDAPDERGNHQHF